MKKVVNIFTFLFVVLMAADASAMELRRFCNTGRSAQHPRTEVQIPQDFKVVGGGARVNWSGAGNLLTASYPEGTRKWVAMAKDHQRSSTASITVCAIGIFDPENDWDVQVWSDTSSSSAHPTMTTTIGSNYSLTGGGARVNWSGAGNLLTASYPRNERTWEVRSKDHNVSSPASITAFAIGIRHRQNGAPRMRIFQQHGDQANHPTTQVTIPSGYMLTGGGALNHWGGAGNLLTTSFPISDRTWLAKGKDHVTASLSSISVFAIAVRDRF